MIPEKIIEPKQEEQVLTALDNISVKKLTNFLGYRTVKKNNIYYKIIKNKFNVSQIK